MSDITIFIKENGPSVVVTEHGGGLLSSEQDDLCKKAFGTAYRRIELSHAELYEVLSSLEVLKSLKDKS